MAGRPPKPVGSCQWMTSTPETLTVPGVSALGDREWNRLAPYMLALKRLQGEDSMAFVRYCTEMGKFLQIIRDGLGSEQVDLAQPGKSRIKPHYLLKPLLDAASQVLDLSIRFGLTPNARHLEGGHGNRKDWFTKNLEGNRRKVAIGAMKDPSVLPVDAIDLRDLEPLVRLNTFAQDQYDLAGTRLQRTSEFTPLDVGPLTVAACLYELYCRAERQRGDDIETEIMNHKSEVDEITHHPLLDVTFKLSGAMSKVCAEYGMTPLDRRVMSGDAPAQPHRIPLVFDPSRITQQ